MRIRSLVAVLAVTTLPACLSAYPYVGGGKGLLWTQNALVQDDAGLTLSLHMVARPRPFTIPGDSVEGVLADGIGALAVTPFANRYFGAELFVSSDAAMMAGFGSGEGGPDFSFLAGPRATVAGAKLSCPYLPVFKAGFSGRYTFIDSTWPDPGSPPVASNPKFDWRGLVTFQFQDLATAAPNLIFNFGRAGQASVTALGLEWGARSIMLSVEGVSEQGKNSTGLLDSTNGRLMLTPAITLGSPTGFGLRMGYTFAYGPNTSPQINFGLMAAAAFFRRAPRPPGGIAGTVTDARTGKPLAAAIRFPDNAKLPLVQTDPVNGTYKLDKIPAGTVTVEASAPDYVLQTVPIAVKPGEYTQYEFKLRPTVVYSTLAGTVTDAATGEILAAQVEFPGTTFPPVATDAATGAFSVQNVPAGTYTVTATAKGYIKGAQAVVVEEGRPATVNFSLSRAAAPVSFTGKVSDKKTGEPVAATLSFPNTDIAEVAADPGTGIFQTEVPAGSYVVQVSAPGYIRQTAAVAMEKDKPLVKDFELVKEGMSITLKGIYFESGKATIKPESRPALEEAAKILADNSLILVEIQGHTDSQGSDQNNQTLSEKRAWSVVDYLVRNFGVDRTRLTAKGYGETRPIASNDTEGGRALNRRVEFVITGQR